MFVNRTKEFKSYLSRGFPKPTRNTKENFYEELLKNLVQLEQSIRSASSFSSFIVYEDRLHALEQSVLVLDSIEVEDQLQYIFTGIKDICKAKLVNCMKLLKSKKISDSTELKAEKPKFIQRNISREKEEYSIPKDVPQEIIQKELEMENQQILQFRDFSETRQRLLQIESIQKSINERLLLQDERIDLVMSKTNSSLGVYKSISDMDFSSGGSYFRRFVAIFLWCLCFLLLYIHIYYNRL